MVRVFWVPWRTGPRSMAVLQGCGGTPGGIIPGHSREVRSWSGASKFPEARMAQKQLSAELKRICRLGESMWRRWNASMIEVKFPTLQWDKSSELKLNFSMCITSGTIGLRLIHALYSHYPTWSFLHSGCAVLSLSLLLLLIYFKYILKYLSHFSTNCISFMN